VLDSGIQYLSCNKKCEK